MNCKPNQLCVIVNGLDNGKQHVGKIVRVTKLNWIWTRCWEYEGQYLLAPDGMRIVCIEDECLKPIDGGESPEESLEAMRDLSSIPSEVTA